MLFRHHVVPDLDSLPLPIFTLQPLDHFKQVALRLRQTIRELQHQTDDGGVLAVIAAAARRQRAAQSPLLAAMDRLVPATQAIQRSYRNSGGRRGQFPLGFDPVETGPA